MSDQDDLATHPPVTPRSSLGSGALSYASSGGSVGGSSISPSTSSSSHGSAKSAVSECLNAWLNYLQVLNNLCASGYRLTQTLSALEQWGHQSDLAVSTTGIGGLINTSQTQQVASSTGNSNNSGNATTSQQQQQQHQQQQSQMSTHFTAAWDDLARATAVATSTVKSHIVSVLQDFITSTASNNDQEIDLQRVRDHNQQIILENAQTMINIQHQFCAASYDAFSSLMCCFICQAPVGFSHDPECAMIQQQKNIGSASGGVSTTEQRSQTPSPHFGAVLSQRNELRNQQIDPRNILFGSGSTQASSAEHVYGGISMDQTGRGPSPHQEIRGPSPVQGFLESIRGPLPNPGHLLGMKAPFYRGSRSPLNFPLFPLCGQRRWSEAAAGEVHRGGEYTSDVESQMRRWSMPWEASKTDKNTVTWHQTRIMPISKLAVPTASKAGSERSQSTTPDSLCQPSITSQDGLAEAIQLLSCRPGRSYSLQQQQSLPSQQHQPMGPPFIEEPAVYEMWPTGEVEDRLPSIKFPLNRNQQQQDRDENPF